MMTTILLSNFTVLNQEFNRSEWPIFMQFKDNSIWDRSTAATGRGFPRSSGERTFPVPPRPPPNTHVLSMDQTRLSVSLNDAVDCRDCFASVIDDWMSRGVGSETMNQEAPSTRRLFHYLYNDQSMHNQLTNYHTPPTCFILREIVVSTFPSHTSMSNAVVGNTIYPLGTVRPSFANLLRTLFMYLINKYISLSDICLMVHHWYK